MTTLRVLGLATVLACTAALAADQPAGPVRDYETRLEDIAKEVQDVRKELETLVQEVVEGEAGRLFLFLEGPAQAFRDKGVALTVDGKPLVSRLLTPAELDVLGRGLPLELAELRVSSGEHKVTLAPLGAESGQPAAIRAERGRVTAWVAKTTDTGVEWRPE